MSQRERVRRPRPSRTGPIRDWRGLLRSPERSAEEPAAGTEDAVARGVRLAYQVAQDKLDEGRRQARLYNDRSHGGWTMTGGSQDPTARLWAQCNEMTRAWMNLWMSAMGTLGSTWMRMPGPWAQQGACSSGPIGFGTELVGGSGSVSLTLEPGLDASRLHCPGLQPLEDKGKAITAVSFSRGEGNELARVRIDVAGAKKGRYGGPILDRDGQRPVGALTLTITG